MHIPPSPAPSPLSPHAHSHGQVPNFPQPLIQRAYRYSLLLFKFQFQVSDLIFIFGSHTLNLFCHVSCKRVSRQKSVSFAMFHGKECHATECLAEGCLTKESFFCHVSCKRVSCKRVSLLPCFMPKSVSQKSVSFAMFHAKETHESETGHCNSIGIELLYKWDTCCRLCNLLHLPGQLM